MFPLLQLVSLRKNIFATCMGKAKMFKIRSIDTFPNVFQNPHFTKQFLVNSEGEELNPKGKWRSDIFKNDNPIVLELACGKGDYAIALARNIPTKTLLELTRKVPVSLPAPKQRWKKS